MTVERERAERDRIVKELFEKALDAPPQEREALLAGCARTSIQRDVRELLRAEAELGEFLETSAGERLLGAVEEERLAPGDVVADFTVARVLGEGGGGVVYEAEQREPRRRVALKMIRVRSRSQDALRRFRDEAANLARLHHAAIAHVYAAGVREAAGRRQPWIAMEQVHGARSIVRHARDAGLDRDAKLRLFLVVCDALHHAHENGVIHRDVTPGNVLVDGEGRPKVVDFGVACGVGDGDERASDAVGTLAYASPEQLTGAAGRVDRRADVYGLGALLYELLTGAVPLDVDLLPLTEAARTKRTAPVPPPSDGASWIPRDLDAIALRALAPEPEGRYPSAAALADDVRRFLSNEPVSAFAGGSWYQLGKFVRRRRAAAAAVAGIAAALVAGTAVSTWFAVQNAAARDLAERRSYVAEVSAAATALRVNDVAEARRRLDRAPAALRDWEWRHLASRLDTSAETASFPRHEMWYGSVSADGGLVAVSGADLTAPGDPGAFVALVRRDGTRIREWRMRRSREERIARLTCEDGAVLAAWDADAFSGCPSTALSCDGRRMAVGLANGQFLVHDVASGVESPLVQAHASRVIDVSFSSDGALLATAGQDGTAAVWSTADLSLVRALPQHGDRVICVAFDPSGGRLATGCRDGRIRVFEVVTGDIVRVLAGHEASVEGVAFSPDGKRLVSVSRDLTVRLWNADADDGGAVAVGRAHTSNVRDVAFDPGGREFVTASWDGTLRTWDARTGVEKAVLRGHGSGVTAVAFADAEPRLVSFSRDGTVKRWTSARPDVATFGGLRDVPTALAFDADGRRLAVGSNDSSVSIVDAVSGALSHRFREGTPGGGAVVAVEFLDDRSLVLLAGCSEFQVWSLPPAGEEATCMRRFGEGLHPFAPAFDLPRSRVWVVDAGDARRFDTTHSIDLATGERVASRSLPFFTTCLACDGRGRLAAGGREGFVALASADGEWRVVRPTQETVRALAFDETGERLVVAAHGGYASVLRTADLSTIHELSGHSDFVQDAAFLPGGRRVVTVSRDLTARLWDPSTGECVLVLHEHGYPVMRVAVSPDRRRIATAAGATEDAESVVKIWDAPAPADPSAR